MAGIGFALRDLVRRDSLWAMFEGQLHGVVAVAGPWFFTIVTMALPALILDEGSGGPTVTAFITLLLYIFSITLTLTSPITITLTRHVSDRIFADQTDTVAASFIGALLLGLLTLIPAWVVGMTMLDLPLQTRIYALLASALVTTNWIGAPMLSTFRKFRLLTGAYALGAAVFWLLLRGERTMDLADLLISFDVSMAFTNAVLCGLVLSRFPGRARPLLAIVESMRQYRSLAWGGLLYGVGMWIDKWIMWTAPGRLVTEIGLASYPVYDTVIFIAFATTVPALALFIIRAETSLEEGCVRFYTAIQRHARKARLMELRADLVQIFLSSARDVALLQLTITALVVLLPVLVLNLTGTPHAGVFMFRFCAIGAAFHLGVLTMSIVLFYFDSRRSVLVINGVLAICNGLGTWLALELGLAWYGFGYFLACIIAFALAWVIVHRTLRDLLFVAFVAQNPAVTEARSRPATATKYYPAQTAPGPLAGRSTP